MRPTKMRNNNGELIEKSEWKTLEKWLHWDLSPFNYEVTPMGRICF